MIFYETFCILPKTYTVQCITYYMFIHVYIFIYNTRLGTCNITRQQPYVAPYLNISYKILNNLVINMHSLFPLTFLFGDNIIVYT